MIFVGGVTNKMKQHNGTVDVLRLIFTICVIMAHFKTQYENEFLPGRWNGHISVEFFFALSGFLMVASSVKHNGEEPVWKKTLSFMYRKVAALAPVYYTTLFCFVVLQLLNISITVTKLRNYLTSLVAPVFFLSAQELESSTSIPFSWYICYMLLAMFVLYPFLILLKRNYTCIVAPLSVVFICSFLMHEYGKLLVIRQDWIGCFYPGLLRAIMGINVGCIAYEISSWLKDTYSSRMTKTGRGLLTALTVCMFLLPIVWMIKGLNGNSHPCVLLMFGAGVALVFSGTGFELKGGKLTGFIGKFCLPLYLGQGLTMKWFPEGLVSRPYGSILYLLACCFTAFLLLFASTGAVLVLARVRKSVSGLCLTNN